ncbi:MAG: methyltransferase domain-containing protein [Zoogloeaceae bacterium]|jgi:predicted SAM-dependent methyltransferase|nr:methyltransferase domain-containing protein [Zoogloeaceae bacterium]
MDKAVIRKLKNTLRPVWYFAKNRVVIKKLLASDKVYVELGAGGITRPGWVGIDLRGADINLDLVKKPLPFPDNSVDRFYSSHVFEHFSYPEPMLSILNECWRCLKNGGTFSICVPDATVYVDIYSKQERPFKPDDYYKPAFHNNSRIDILNYIAYMDGHHKHLFDIEGLLSILSKSGFQNVEQRDFNPDLDLEVRHWGSIYAVATK